MDEQIRIEKIVHRGERVLITLSDDKAALSLSEELVHSLRLVQGIVLTPSQLERLRLEAELYRCYQTTARMLALRGHSIGELRQKLIRKSFDRDIISKVVAEYRRRGVLDDAKYAHTVARQLLERKPCGRSFLLAYLQQKLIDRSIAEEIARIVLDQTDEPSRARAALEKRWSMLAEFELETARQKSYNYLVRRGFGYDAAKKAFEALYNRKNEVTRD